MEPTFDHVVLESEGGASLHALINGDLGLLMFLRGPGDAGFSSLDADYTGPPSQMVEYRLDDGRVEHDPRSSAVPRATVDRALIYFEQTGAAPDFVVWNNDSGDGRQFPSTSVRQSERSGRVW